MEQIHLKIQRAIGPHSGLIEKIPLYVFIATFFLLPIFFIPSDSSPVFLVKQSILFSGTLFVLLSWLLLRLIDGNFSVPRLIPFAFFALVPLSVLVSFVFSPVKGVSFMGSGSEIDTLFSMILLSSILFLIPATLRTKKSIFIMYSAFLASFTILGLFYLVRAFSAYSGGDALSFGGYFPSITSNPLGKWNDVAVFSGASLLISMFTFYFLQLPKIPKILLSIISVLSILMLVLVNFTALWYALAIFSLVFFVYSVVISRNNISMTAEGQPDGVLSVKKKMAVLPLIVFIISAIFIADSFRAVPADESKDTLSTSIAKSFTINHLEVRPSWASTMDVASKSLSGNPITGVGPAKFVSEWLRFKPASINSNPFFWDIDYQYGIGLIPTFLVTGGLLGGISWILFFAALVYLGYRYTVMPHDDKALRYITVSSFFTSVFFWVFTIIYVPGITIFSLAFLFTGIFIATLFRHEGFKTIEFKLFENPSTAFVSVTVLVLLVLGTLTGGYLVGKNLLAGLSFQKAISTFNAGGDINEIDKYISRAASLGGFDVYDRVAADLGVIKMRNVITSKGATLEVLQGEFRDVLSSTIDYARRATEINPTNYQNWVSLGRIYKELVPSIDGAYSQADEAYSKAIELNPHHPEVYLLKARLELANQNTGKAKEYIVLSLAEKQDYAAAIFLQSQIESSEGNIKAAIASAEKVSLLAPNDTGVFFQLGLLKYNDREWKGAVAALERAVALNQTYANARYFLGLSYHRLGEWDKAVSQFEEISKTNPDNNEVSQILSNLKARKSPFSGIETEPEKRTSLPIEERSANEPGATINP